MWRHKRTFLRLLEDVYIEQSGKPSLRDDEIEEIAVINRGKLDKLVNYLNLCPKKLAKVCKTLYLSIKANHLKKSRRKIVQADFMIFEVMCHCDGELVVCIVSYDCVIANRSCVHGARNMGCLLLWMCTYRAA